MASSQNKKRKTVWNDSYKTEFNFIAKFDETHARCVICSSKFSISHGGRADIVKHKNTQSHKTALEAYDSTKKVSDYFSRKQTEEEIKVAAQEALIAYHTARHNLSFRSNDCLSKIIKCVFETKYGMARTKTGVVITKLIAPMINSSVDSLIETVPFASLIVDTSNHKNIKMLPIVMRCFDPLNGIINKLLCIEILKDEKSTTLSQTVLKVMDEKSLREKLVGITADNTNVNFGGVNRRGTENLFRKLQNELKREIIGCGCLAHIAHNSISAGCEVIPIELDAIAVKIYKHFCIHTIRNERFKTFCDEMENSYKPLKNHLSIRFLSLEPALKRILELYEPLKEYFDACLNCPRLIRQFFNDKTAKFWLLFVLNQLENFCNCIKKLEKSEISSFETATELKLMKSKIMNRKSFLYIPREAKDEFEKLPLNVSSLIKSQIFEFYDVIESYLEIWSSSYDGTDVFDWMLMNKYPEWIDIQKSYNFAEVRFGPEAIRQIINLDHLFDEYALIKRYIEQRLNDWNGNKTNAQDIWIETFKKFTEDGMKLNNLEKLVQYAFCLAGTSTENERIFSLIGNIWTDDRNHLDFETVQAITQIQYNSDMKCMEFHSHIKNNINFLSKVQSSEKYSVEIA